METKVERGTRVFIQIILLILAFWLIWNGSHSWESITGGSLIIFTYKIK